MGKHPLSSTVGVKGSRYTPAGGWASYRFDEYTANGAYGGGTPEVAVSDNGEAMFVWREATGTDGGGISYVLRSMRYSNGWEAPGTIEGPSTASAPVGFTVGADAQGDFVAAWLEQGGTSFGIVRAARYARGSGWGPVEEPTKGPDGGSQPDVFGVSVTVEA